MNVNHFKINNSYDSESLSTSMSSTSDNIEKSFDDQICTLPELLSLDQLQKQEKAFSSQESDFKGFNDSNVNRTDEVKKHIYSPFCMYDQNLTFEKEKNIKISSDPVLNLCLISNESKITTTAQIHSENIIEKPIKEEMYKEFPSTITNKLEYSTENSCNAVDINLRSTIITTVGESFTKDLSFNGKIDSILNKTENILSISENINNNLSKKTLEELQEINDDAIKDKKNNLDISLELLENDTSGRRQITNEKSPDLFADDESEEEEETNDVETQFTLNQSITTENLEEDVIVKNERLLLNRLQMSLTGVLPPPSIRISQLNIERMLQLFKQNLDDYNKKDIEDNTTKKEKLEQLFVPVHSIEEAKSMPWPEVMKARAHGICLNRTPYTDKIESLSLKYVDRNIGAETSSSFNFRSPEKKQNIRFKNFSQSPGSRLSHLARRRAVFSSANLQANAGQLKATTSNASRVLERQILLEPKKSKILMKGGNTPKRRRTTPGKRKSPSPSVKIKENINIINQNVVPSRETSKRALFQSPPKTKLNRIPSIPSFTPEVALRLQKSKRVLFSPAKLNRCSSFTCNERNNDDQIMKMRYNSLSCITDMSNNRETLINKTYKRKFSDLENENNDIMKDIHIDSSTENLAYTSKFVRSKSLSATAVNTQKSVDDRSFLRTTSEVVMPTTSTHLSDSHKKKLLWAVSQALQNKQITFKHNNFKQYVCVLARVSKRLYLEYESQNLGSTSEKMLRLTNRLVYSVIQGKTIEEIYSTEKQKMDIIKKNIKLTGYITAEDYKMRQYSKAESTVTSASTDTSIDYKLSNNTRSTEFVNQLGQHSQTFNCSQTSSNSFTRNNSQKSSLHLSSSKNNENFTVLRENVDNEQRQKSTQKNVYFSGKNQKNISPYNDKNLRTSLQTLMVGGAKNANILKAKRQISFDT